MAPTGMASELPVPEFGVPGYLEDPVVSTSYKCYAARMRFLDQILTSQVGICLLLFVAAFLEVWGDSYFSSALHRSSGVSRWVFLVAGATILSLYGLVVNLSKWDFGTLLGVYVFFFYVAAQIINWARFKQAPGLPACVGALLFAAGAAVIRFWKV